MTHDPTESKRRKMVGDINSQPRDRVALEAAYGDVWSTDEMRERFEVLGFGAPLCIVKRKSDGQKGSLMFQHHPRLYFQFQEHAA